jgi:hypothetical protein
MKDKEKNCDDNFILKDDLFEEKEIKKTNSINLSPVFFEESKNFISKESFFSNRNKSQSENSNEETLSVSQRNSFSNLLLS